jgi:hypothetical protein
VTNPEADILRHFRRYLAHEGQMVFFQAGTARAHPPSFYHAIESLIRNGMLIKERHRDAYSLTKTGYQQSFELPPVVSS